jgi:hypothetical protein
LKRELNRPEIAAREAIETSNKSADIYRLMRAKVSGPFHFFEKGEKERVCQWLIPESGVLRLLFRDRVAGHLLWHFFVFFCKQCMHNRVLSFTEFSSTLTGWEKTCRLFIVRISSGNKKLKTILDFV